MKEKNAGWNRVKKWGMEHPVKCAVIGIFALPTVMLIVLLARYGGFHRDEWVGIASGLLAYAGTCILGLLAFWQNIRAQEVNERLLKIEEAKYRVIVEARIINMSQDETGLRAEICVSNIGEATAEAMCVDGVIATIEKDIYRARSYGGLWANIVPNVERREKIFFDKLFIKKKMEFGITIIISSRNAIKIWQGQAWSWKIRYTDNGFENISVELGDPFYK